MNEIEAAAYLAAFIDGEGHIGCHVTRRGRTTKTIAFNNTDKQLLDRVIDIAKSIGLDFRAYPRKGHRPKWSDRWDAYLRGGRPAFERFRSIVPIQADRKKVALDELVDSYASPETLEALYASRRTSVLRHCLTCDAPFYAFPADINRNQGKFCSVKCGALARSRLIERICATCGNAFAIPPSRKDRARFCSKRCSGVSKSDRMRAMASVAANARWRPT